MADAGSAEKKHDAEEILKRYNERVAELKAEGRRKADMIASSELRPLMTPKAQHGHMLGIMPGRKFADRGEMAVLGLHNQIMRGIDSSSSEPKGAYAIVMSGGYKDNTGDWYTGTGGRNSSNQQVEDQDWSKGDNAGLRLAYEHQTPIRVFRAVVNKATKEKGYEYCGLFLIVEAEKKPSADGPLVCSFRLEGIPGEHLPLDTEVHHVTPVPRKKREPAEGVAEKKPKKQKTEGQTPKTPKPRVKKTPVDEKMKSPKEGEEVGGEGDEEKAEGQESLKKAKSHSSAEKPKPKPRILKPVQPRDSLSPNQQESAKKAKRPENDKEGEAAKKPPKMRPILALDDNAQKSPSSPPTPSPGRRIPPIIRKRLATDSSGGTSCTYETDEDFATRMSGRRVELEEEIRQQEHVVVADITGGAELLPIPAINETDDSAPAAFKYIRESVFAAGIEEQVCGALEAADVQMELYRGPAGTCAIALSALQRQQEERLVAAGQLPSSYILTKVPYTPDGRLHTNDMLGHCECGPSCSGNECAAQRVVQRGVSAALELRWSQAKGWGLFTRQHLLPGTFIATYAGEFVNAPRPKNGTNGGADRVSDADDRPQYCLQLDAFAMMSDHLDRFGIENYLCKSVALHKVPPLKPFTDIKTAGAKTAAASGKLLAVDGSNAGNVARFINHSCDGGNLVFQPVFGKGASNTLLYHGAFFVGESDIQPGTELTFDYGLGNRKSRLGEIKTCACGSARCRGSL